MTTTSRTAPGRRADQAPRRSVVGWLAPATVLALLAGLIGLAPSASAEEGPAGAPDRFTVLSKVHTDAVSTFLKDGQFSLGTRADTPDPGTEYDPAKVWFHVDDASKLTVPATGYDFIAPAGTEVWIAPESNPGGQQLWPGFSTEGVPNDAIAGNTTTFTLTDVRGPEGGSVEVYTGNGATDAHRRWSSDEDHKTFTLGRTHSHANWAFTRAGTYELDVRAQVTLGGSPAFDTATYTFVVGPLPERVATTTSLEVSDESVTQGSELTLSAEVTPAAVAGAVEFRRGGTVLGHDPVENGRAELAVSDLPTGTHQITAAFVPAIANLATGSTSDAVAVTVTDGTGTPFSLTGVGTSYDPGETLQARVAGATLGEGQEIQWRMRPAGTTYAGTVLSRFVPETDNDDARAGRLDLVMQASYDGYQLQAALVQGDQTIATTAWSSTISVADSVEPLSLGYSGPTPFRPGDVATLPVTGRQLGDGETLRVVTRPALGHFNLWNPVGPGFEALDGRTFAFEPSSTSIAPLALQVVADGVVVAQSEPLVVEIASYEFFFEGMQPLYRAGQTFDATMRVTPELGDRVTYTWAMYDDYENPMKIASGEAGRTFAMPVTSAMDGKRMFIQANVRYPSGNQTLLGGAYPHLTVTDQQGQLFQFSSLSDHYHQGSPVNLQLTADPGLVEGDLVGWEWRWPGTGWEALPGAEGLTHRFTAEQAMEGVQVRAALTFADSETEPMVAGPVTIHVDDHGTPAVQVPAVAGRTEYAEGDSLALSLELPEEGPTVLAHHRWERRTAGSGTWAVVPDQSGDQLTTPVVAADDGASYRVSILKPNGQVAYGPSPAVTISVESETSGRQFAVVPLEAHYHSGEEISLSAVTDPALTKNDFLQWEWSFPGSEEWSYLPQCCVPAQVLVAEQGLDGAQLRATLYDADGVHVSEPVTIHVDDHGGEAAQVPSVGGLTSYVEGETLALTRELPDDVTTVLPDHRWERRAAGAGPDAWEVVEGETGDELTVAATLADDGASYRVSVATPAGAVAYGPSEAVTVSVSPETATELGLAGVEDSYEVGDVLRARVVGRAATAGQTWRFFIRTVGSTGAGSTFYGDGYSHGDDEYAAWDAGRVRQTLDAGFAGYEVRARLREGGVYVAQTEWVAIDVNTTEAPLSMTFPEGPHHGSDEIAISFTGEPAAGDSVRLVYRAPGGLWSDAYFQTVEGGVLRYLEPYPSGTPTEYALQVERDGVAVSISAPVTRTVNEREVMVQGVQGVYRVGQTLSASATVYPALEGVTYSWHVQDTSGRSVLLKEGMGEDALSIELPMTADLDGARLSFQATLEHPRHGTIYPASWSSELRVSTAAPDEQLLFFKSLSGHYHQGYDIDLEIVADPALGADDTITWEWKWPGEGQEWIPFQGPSGPTHRLIAEQALADVQVRATVDFADEGEETMTAEVTIHHDDHGGVARQQPTIEGDLTVAAGETATLTRVLPANGSTVLTEHRWERKVGDGDWTVVAGETGSELSFRAAAADDGARYRVSILKPNGEVAYGPSPVVTLAVSPGAGPGPGEPGPDPEPGAPDTEPVPDDQLTEPNAGGVEVPGEQESFAPGDRVPATVGREYAGQWVSGWLHSNPAWLGWVLVDESGRVQVDLPEDAPAGAHKLVFKDTAGALIGWTELTVEPESVDPVPAATTVTAPDVRGVYGKPLELEIAVAPAASGVVSVELPGTTEQLMSELAGGRAVVKMPAGALAPGAWELPVAYAGVPGEFEASTGSVSVRVAKADPRVKVRPMQRRVEAGGTAVLRVAVSGAGVDPTGEVRVRIGRLVETVELNANGRKVVRIAVPPKARPGLRTVRVVYAGDEYVAAERVSRVVRIIR